MGQRRVCTWSPREGGAGAGSPWGWQAASMPRTGPFLDCWALGSCGEAGRGGLGPSFRFLSAFVMTPECRVCSLSSSFLISAVEQRLRSWPPASGEVTEQASRAPAGRDRKTKTASGRAAPLSAHPGLDSQQKGCSNANTAATPHHTSGHRGRPQARPPPLEDTRYCGPLCGLGVPGPALLR